MAARANGIDFVMLKDHNWLQARHDGYERSYAGVQLYIDWVRSKGGIGFIAHPGQEGAPRFHVKQFNWNDWTVTGYRGIAIWDFMTDWQGLLKGYVSALLGYYFPACMLKRPKKVTLERWDELNRKIILSILRRGRVYVAFEYFERALGFSFVVMDESEVATMRDDFYLDDLAIVQAELPKKGENPPHSKRKAPQRGGGQGNDLRKR